MKRLLFIPLLFIASLSGAQVVVTVSPGNPSTGKLTVPVKWWQTFSAHVDGANDRKVAWSVNGSAVLKGDTSCAINQGISSDCEIAVYDTVQEAVTVTATADADHTTTGTGAVVFGPIPTPSTSHPREWLTPGALSALQTYCGSGGTIPAAFTTMANNFAATDDVAWNPSSGGGGYTGVVGSWPGGGTGLPNATYIAGSLVNNSNFPELTAMVYALMANCDPNSTNRAAWTIRAHDQYIMNMKEILGLLPGENPLTCNCLGGPHFALGNRGSVWGVGVGLVPDWIYSSFSTADFKLIQPALIQMQGWANTNAGAIATSTPVPLGVVNDPSIFDKSSTDAYGYIRNFENNYGLFYGSMEIASGLAIDATQDPATNAIATATIASGGSGWAVNDTFNIEFNSYPGGAASVYKVTAVSGGVVTGITPVSTGGGYSVASAVATFAISPSTGTGLTVNITALQAHCAGGATATCSDGVPNSVRAGFTYGMGAWMYLANANFEDPSISTAEYNQIYGSSLTPSDTCTSNFNANPTPISATMPCYGNERGGLSHEGAPTYIIWLLHYANVAMMLQSSGNMDATNNPQISVFTSAWWDQMVSGYEHLMVPAIYQPASTPFQNVFAYGPANSTYDQVNLMANTPISLYDLDKAMGRNDARVNAEGWVMGNLDPEFSISTNIQGNIPAAMNMLLTELPGSTPFSTFTDPRPSMSPWFFSYNAGTLITSTGSWSSTTGGVFRHYCPRFPQPNHEEGYCGTFDFWLNGDWVTKGIYSYAFNDNTNYWTGEAPDTGNMAGYGNTAPAALPNPNIGEYIVDGLANRGGQFNNGYPTGESINDDYADSSTYTADHLDETGQKNWYGPIPGVGAGGSQAVTAATTDYLWIKPHYLFAYDRGNVSTPSFMRRWFMSTGTPTVSGANVSWPSALNKTSNYLHVLLQPSTNVAVYPVYPFGEFASGDYTVGSGGTGGQEILIDSNPINSAAETFTTTNCTNSTGTVCVSHQATFITNVSVTGGVSCGTLTALDIAHVGPPATSCHYFNYADGSYLFNAADLAAGVTVNYTYSTTASSARFLEVIEGQNFGTGATGATLVQSSAGQNFDCGLVSTNLVCFMRNLAGFTGVTYAASGATAHYVSNLTPNTTYTLTGTGTPATATADNNGTLTFAATGTGNIVITPSGGVAAPTSLQGVIIKGATIQ